MTRSYTQSTGIRGIFDAWKGKESEIERLRESGVFIAEIARRLGISTTNVTIYLSGVEYMEDDDEPRYLPTPEDIKARCQEIQRGWTPGERRNRAVIKNPPAMTPTLNRPKGMRT